MPVRRKKGLVERIDDVIYRASPVRLLVIALGMALWIYGTGISVVILIDWLIGG